MTERGERVNCTTVGTSALAVFRALEKEEEMRDRYLYVAEMTMSQNEIIAFLEEKTEKKFAREEKSTEEAERRSRELWKKAFEDGTFSYEGLMLEFNRIMYRPGKESDWTGRNDNALQGIETRSIEDILKVCGAGYECQCIHSSMRGSLRDKCKYFALRSAMQDREVSKRALSA